MHCRERALREAATRPIFSGAATPRSVDPSDLYPHVYDSLLKAKQTSAFVDGAKVSSTGIAIKIELQAFRIHISSLECAIYIYTELKFVPFCSS